MPTRTSAIRRHGGLRYQTAWRRAGRFPAALIAGTFLSFALLLAVGPHRHLLPAWLGLLALLEVPLYLLTGPLYRPDVVSARVREDGVMVGRRDKTQAWVPFRDLARFTSTSASSVLVRKSGDREVLGYGFGGSQGEIIGDAFRAWARRENVPLLEHETRDFFGRPRTDLEAWARSERLEALEHLLVHGEDDPPAA